MSVKIANNSSHTPKMSSTEKQSSVSELEEDLNRLSVDELVERLTPSQVETFLGEADPDDSSIPPSMRTSYKCPKESTGPLDREKLLDYINKDALSKPDIPDLVPYVPNTMRGKKFEDKSGRMMGSAAGNNNGHNIASSLAAQYGLTESACVGPLHFEVDIVDGNSTNKNDSKYSNEEMGKEKAVAVKAKIDCDEALAKATTSDIIDLASILGMHSLINQDQFHNANNNGSSSSQEAIKNVGWHGVTKASPLKIFNDGSEGRPNDPKEIFRQIKDSDSSLTDINLNNNNMTNVMFGNTTLFDEFISTLEGLEKHSASQIRSLSLANCFINDSMFKRLCSGSVSDDMESTEGQKNQSLLARKLTGLQKVNVESNCVTPAVLVEVFKTAIDMNELTEIKASNQKAKFLGHQSEIAITEAIESNDHILKVGMHFQFGECRNRISVHIQKNLDGVRLRRLAKQKHQQQQQNQ